MVVGFRATINFQPSNHLTNNEYAEKKHLGEVEYWKKKQRNNLG
jgi:hypothetical protein